MNLFKKTLVFSAIALLSSAVNAELISYDWKEVGDRAIVEDTETNLKVVKSYANSKYVGPRCNQCFKSSR